MNVAISKQHILIIFSTFIMANTIMAIYYIVQITDICTLIQFKQKLKYSNFQFQSQFTQQILSKLVSAKEVNFYPQDTTSFDAIYFYTSSLLKKNCQNLLSRFIIQFYLLLLLKNNYIFILTIQQLIVLQLSIYHTFLYSQQTKMSILELEVQTLRKKVKDLEDEITDRTRNYLIQIQKLKKADYSATKKGKQQPNDELSIQNGQLIEKLKRQLKQFQRQNASLANQVNQSSKRIDEIISERAQERLQYTAKIDETKLRLEHKTKQLDDAHKQIDIKSRQFRKTMGELQEKISLDISCIKNLQDELKRCRVNYQGEELNIQILKLKQENGDLTKKIRALQNNKLKISQNLQFITSKDQENTNIEILNKQIQQLKANYLSMAEQKKGIQLMLENSLNDTKQFKEKYYTQIANNNQYLEQLSNIKSQLSLSEQSLKSLQKKHIKLQQKLSVQNANQGVISKETKQAYTNTDNSKSKDNLKKSSHSFDPPQLIPSPQQVELVKLNDKLNLDLIRKEQEYRRLLEKIDQIQSQNNKLIGTVQSLKRDISYQKEAQKILQGNIKEHVHVIQNQKNTIMKLQRQYDQNIKEYQLQIQQLSERLNMNLAEQVILQSPNQNTSHQSSAQSNKSMSSQKNSKRSKSVKSNKETKQIQNIDQYSLLSDIQSPNVNVLDVFHGQFNQLTHSSEIHNEQNYISQRNKNQNSPIREGPKVRYKLEFSKLEKKFSSNTCENKPEPPRKVEELETRTVSSRGMKSSRILTPHDLKINIKTILDNSILLGKGVESIEVVTSLVKQIESFTGYPYQDIVADLQKKKDTEKSAFNNNIIKEISEISKIRQQCQQRIQQTKEEDKQLMREKDEQIHQLRVQILKQQSSIQNLQEKIQYLQNELQKSKKIESQKQLIPKLIVSKNSENENIVEKLKHQKAFLTQKIQKYEQSIEQYDIIKRKMFSQNQKQKTEISLTKSVLKKLQQQFRRIQKMKTFNMKKIEDQSNQFVNILNMRIIDLQKKNKQIQIQFKDKQQSLYYMVQQVDGLKQKLKEREDDLMQVGRQIHQIRAAHMKLEIQQNGQSLSILKKQQLNLKNQLKAKQQNLYLTQKQLSRHRSQIILLQKQLQQQKQKVKGHIKAKRQVMDQVATQKSLIQSLQKRLAICTQQESYQYQKSSNQFQQVMEKLFYIRKRQKQNKIKNRLNNNITFKTVNSTSKFQQQTTSNEKIVKELKSMKEILKVLAQTIYQTYTSLPLTSETSTLFQAENKEQLINQLNDIKKFADDYVRLKQEVDSQTNKTQLAYLGLVKGIVRNVEQVTENVLVSVIDQLKVGPNQHNKLRGSVPAMMSSRDIPNSGRSNNKKKPSIQLQM